MKRNLLVTILTVLSISRAYSQNDRLWTAAKNQNIVVSKNVKRLSFPNKFDLYSLNFDVLKQLLYTAPDRFLTNKGVIISLPNTNGVLERFEMLEASNFDSELQAQFPDIRAYVGLGIDDKHAQLRLSLSPQGIQTMVFRADSQAEFMEPYSEDATVYAVYKSARDKGAIPFTCSTEDKRLFNETLPKIGNTNRSNVGQLKTMRLAQSCNGEYAAYFGASTAGNAVDTGKVLAAFNATLTRCNGVYEKDLAVHLTLIASTTNVIFYNASTDPYTTLTNWNKQLQNTLSTKLTGTGSTLAANNAVYDIGHMFGASGGGGNAGCIGCVCVDDTSSTTDLNKGSGITSPADGIPMGDNFDIDYVVHEMGHQMGGNHTFSNNSEGTGVNMEVGSGVTIMGYAGITSQDVAMHSIDIYHAATIEQIQANLATKTCPTITTLANVAPLVNAGSDYTIPKSTPFILNGSATDANGDALTYCWEQYDDCGSQTGANSVAKIAKTVGPNFRSYSPTVDSFRYFPNMTTVLANGQTTAGTGNDGINVEALSSVARTLNFRLTVRDNVATAGQTNFDDMVVTVDATKGPFTVTSQSTTGITYEGGSTQTITWNVASTSSLAGASTVDVYLSTDANGTTATFPTLVASGLTNSGTASVVIPNIPSSTCRFMVKASSNIFFNVNTTNFTITPSLSNEAFGLNNFSLYPNPSKGNFTIQFDSNSTNDIEILVNDIGGRNIYQRKFPNTAIFSQNLQLDSVQSGVYLVTVKDGDKKVVKKIIVE
ncbi:MAG: reprolysin-like metallopeptidase [Flavobacterium sp.]